jgi:hypothetical protein
MTVSVVGVSCVSPSFCEAVGSYVDRANGAAPSVKRSVALAEEWNGTDWAIQTTPDPTGDTAVVSLAAVSCPSATFCEAVGSYTAGGRQWPLAEVWNGTGWALQPTPDPAKTVVSLDGVSCPSATTCQAVGSYTATEGTALAEGWNGKTWAVETTPQLAGKKHVLLSGVSCPLLTSCEAVGEYFNHTNASWMLLAEIWNGSHWAVQTVPNVVTGGYQALNGVSCPSAKSCEAVGYDLTSASGMASFAEGWNGTAWVVQRTVKPAGNNEAALFGVSCVSATLCEAAGDYGTGHGLFVGLAEQWNGTAWTVQTAPSPPAGSQVVLDGVSCVLARSCEAVGHYDHTPDNGADDQPSFAESWDGDAWAVQNVVNPDADLGGSLDAVSCVSARFCEAVDSLEPAAERWNGTAWVIQTIPTPTGNVFVSFTGVSCVATNACEAVGVYEDSSAEGRGRLLAEHWNGRAWALQTVPNPAGNTDPELTGVSCASSGPCEAAGYYNAKSGKTVPVAEGWNGTAWAVQTVPDPRSALGAEFSGVSCVANSCEAVGESDEAVPFAERWNGTAWATQTVPPPAGNEVSLYAVSCPSATSCEAVGYGLTSSNGWIQFAEAWNGATWAVQAIPDPASSGEPSLNAVSCGSASSCEAVGSNDHNSATTQTLAEVWDGTDWTVQTTPNPKGDKGANLAGLSCVAASCQAVGGYETGANLAHTLVEQYVGT